MKKPVKRRRQSVLSRISPENLPTHVLESIGAYIIGQQIVQMAKDAAANGDTVYVRVIPKGHPENITTDIDNFIDALLVSSKIEKTFNQ